MYHFLPQGHFVNHQPLYATHNSQTSVQARTSSIPALHMAQICRYAIPYQGQHFHNACNMQYSDHGQIEATFVV